jgi:hypothetical protein
VRRSERWGKLAERGAAADGAEQRGGAAEPSGRDERRRERESWRVGPAHQLPRGKVKGRTGSDGGLGYGGSWAVLAGEGERGA